MSTTPTDATAAAPDNRPAAALTGLVLGGRWRVAGRYVPGDEATGGYFSVGYLAEELGPDGQPTGEVAFVKAMDYARWRNLSPLPLSDALQLLSSAFIFERDIVRECTDRKMTNVVRGVDHGSVDVPGFEPLSSVDYLVFEVADGDVRKHLDSVRIFDEAWALRLLHNVANGLRQLHQAGLAHQDLKPSNVLVFQDCSKIGDLGRAYRPGAVAAHIGACVPGDFAYAPPEFLYGHFDPDSPIRCRAADAYHLGSMVMFMFARVGATPALASAIEPQLWYPTWGGTFDQVLPHLRDAFDRVLQRFSAEVPEHLRKDLLPLVRELCDPDPATRGNPKAAPPQRYSMERYVSVLDRLARSAELGLRQELR